MDSASSIAGGESPYAVQLELLLELPDEIRLDHPVQWADEDITRLREGLLKDSLQVILDDRNRRSTKREIWRWVDSESCHPFSFAVCAAESGLDADQLRVLFRSMVRKQERSAKRSQGQQ